MKGVSKKVRQEVFLRGGGVCAYCGEPLPEKGFHVDHVEPQSLRFYHFEKDVHRVDNLRASCRSCNILKGSHSLETFRYMIGEFYRTLRRDSRYRCLLRFNRILETHVENEVSFHFEGSVRERARDSSGNPARSSEQIEADSPVRVSEDAPKPSTTH